MLNLSITRARPGMVLSMPVFHPAAPGHVLLKPGFELDAGTILRLAELKVPQVWIRYPALDALMRFVSPEVAAAHAELTHTLSAAFTPAQEGASTALDFGAYASAVKGLVTKLGENPGAQLLVGGLVHADSGLVAHSSNVCFLSLLMGLKLDAYIMSERTRVGPLHARNIESLGVGALLHDIGHLRTPPEVLRAFAQSGDERDPEYQRHAQVGFEMVKGKVEPTAAAAVLHHHQRADGTGFPTMPAHGQEGPRPLKGAEVHIFARIIGAADLFDRIRNPMTAEGEVRRGAVPVVRVLNTMRQEVRIGRLDPMVFKALLWAAPPFAPGSMVRLSNGRAAVVLGYSPFDPCRPRVQMARPGFPGGVPEEGDLLEKVDLATAAETIVECEDQNVAGDLFFPANRSEFDLRVQSRPVSELTRERPTGAVAMSAPSR
ncbi:MAG: HD-GYP domain-containing protein [Phycisphaerales bacterium]